MHFLDRLLCIKDEIKLGLDCSLLVERDRAVPGGRYYFQIQAWRRDAITGELGMGFGGKAYLSEYATDSELIQIAFGLYKSYWEHEARETFKWRDRRVFGPHIATEALWEVANRVEVRAERKKEDWKE